MSRFQQKKNHKAYKEIGKYDPFKGRKIRQQKLLAIKPDIGLLDKDSKNSYLKDAPRTN